MSWLFKLSQSPIRIIDECTGSSHGQVDCILKAYFNDRLVGYLKYAIFEGNAHIQHIEVAEDMRRKGIATQLFERLKEETRGEVIHKMQTPDGAAWVNSL